MNLRKLPGTYPVILVERLNPMSHTLGLLKSTEDGSDETGTSTTSPKIIDDKKDLKKVNMQQALKPHFIFEEGLCVIYLLK